MKRVDPTEARQIIKALRSGATPSQFADRISVGQKFWFESAIKMMEENADDRHFEVRFVRAAYGGGKTLFMKRLEARAQERGWATAFILLRHGKVELDKPNTLAAELCEHLDLGDRGRGLYSLLVAALEEKGRMCGILRGRSSSLAEHVALENSMGDLCARKMFSGDLTIALRHACKAYVRNDAGRLREVADWMGGSRNPLVVPTVGTRRMPRNVIRPLGTGAAESLIRLVAELALIAGKRGLFVALDEVELIGGLVERRRANAFQTLRALVDQNDPDTLPPATSMFLAATPQMFEDRKMFPSYKALQDRIETLPAIDGNRQPNYRSNVVDLDSTPLGEDELVELGTRIVSLWAVAGEAAADRAHQRVGEIAKAIVSRHDFTIARPRLFCRLVVDMLGGALEQNVDIAADKRAAEIGRSRSDEVAVR